MPLTRFYKSRSEIRNTYLYFIVGSNVFLINTRKEIKRSSFSLDYFKKSYTEVFTEVFTEAETPEEAIDIFMLLGE